MMMMMMMMIRYGLFTGILVWSVWRDSVLKKWPKETAMQDSAAQNVSRWKNSWIWFTHQKLFTLFTAAATNNSQNGLYLPAATKKKDVGTKCLLRFSSHVQSVAIRERCQLACQNLGYDNTTVWYLSIHELSSVVMPIVVMYAFLVTYVRSLGSKTMPAHATRF